MPSVGGVLTDLVQGVASSLKTQVRTWKVPGVNGYGAHDYAAGDGQFQFELTHHGLEAAVNIWIAAIEALQGSVVTIIDDWGGTFTYRLITQAQLVSKRAAVAAGRDTKAVMVVRGVAV